MWKKIIGLAGLFLGLYPILIFAQGPERMEGGWFYRLENGDMLKDEFAAIDGCKYYFGSDGRLKTECVITYDGRQYGLGENGSLLKNTWKKMKQENEEERWMYFGFDGRAFTDGWLSDGGDRYHFTNGKMDYGWYTDETGSVYYLGGADEGKAHTGWFVWKGGDVPDGEKHPAGWYYFTESVGKMIANREMRIGEDVYAFMEDGTEASGFCTIESDKGKTEKYFDPASGKRAVGWMYVNEDAETDMHPAGWYYFVDGIPLSPEYCTIKLSDSIGTARIGEVFYAFETGGKMVTGLVQASNGKRYYFDSDGQMKTGSVCVFKEGGRSEYLYFETEGASPPALGGTVTGRVGDFVYSDGELLQADNDRYELVTVGDGTEQKSYIIAADGRIQKKGTVKLDNGKYMRIYSENGSYGWEETTN